MGAQNMRKLLMCIGIIAYARADDKIDTFVDEQYFPAEVETEFVEEMTEVTKKSCPDWCTNAKRRKHFLDTGVVKKKKDYVDPLCTWKKCFKCTGWLDKCPDLKVVKKGPAFCADEATGGQRWVPVLLPPWWRSVLEPAIQPLLHISVVESQLQYMHVGSTLPVPYRPQQ